MTEQKDETKAIRIQSERTHEREHSTPMYLTSSFVFDDSEQMRATFADEQQGNIYSRFTNPNVKEFVDKMVALEGVEAGYATATGMAAVFASIAALLKTGDHILVCRSIFGSSHTVFTKILPKWGITHTYVDIDHQDNWGGEVKENTKMLFIETPSNPGVDLVDLEKAGQLSKTHGLIFSVDNCFATPAIQKPIQFGADLIIHSATKYLDGQGRVMGGVVVGRQDLIDEIYTFCRSTGPAMSPFNAWVLSKSIETLYLRMERHSENGLKLAKYLEAHPEVESVKYPFLLSHPQYEIAQKQMASGGGIVSFKVSGGLERGKEFLDSTEMCSLTANLGDTRTIISHPASTTHAKLTEDERLRVGITPNLIRVSVGLESIIDIIHDIDQALEKSKV
jgi:O-succinylhomoserine sulfhydrylase